MIYPKIEDCIAKAGCKYTLAVLIAKRAKDLVAKNPTQFTGGAKKELSHALVEIAEGRIAPNMTGMS